MADSPFDTADARIASNVAQPPVKAADVGGAKSGRVLNSLGPSQAETSVAVTAVTSKAAEAQTTSKAAEAQATLKAAEVQDTSKAAEVQNTSKPAEAQTMSKAAEASATSKAAEVQNTSKSAEVQDTSKAAEVQDTSKAAEASATSKAAEVQNTSKAVEVQNMSKAVEVQNTSKAVEAQATSKAAKVQNTSKAAEVQNTSKAAEVQNTSKAVEVQNTSKAVEVQNTSKAAEVQDTSKAAEAQATSEVKPLPSSQALQTSVSTQEATASETEEHLQRDSNSAPSNQKSITNAASGSVVCPAAKDTCRNSRLGETQAFRGRHCQMSKATTLREDHAIEMAYKGCCPLELLPPVAKKVVRIFVSSTFSDTKEERNAFMKHVYPKISALCREQYGLEFQVVDMRWGVPEYASDHHTTADLCLQEIRKCQAVSAGPSFLAILGNKYGYRPIPSVISHDEFEVLANEARSAVTTDWQLVQDWYRCDDNAIPPEYVLLPISAKIEHYNSMDNPELKKKANDTWNLTYSRLTVAVRSAARLAQQAGKLPPQAAHKYFISVTESEILEGVLESRGDPKESCLGIIRRIPDIDDYLEATQAPRFIDVQQDQKTLDEEAQSLLRELREQKLGDRVPLSNISMVDISWSASGANVSLENLDIEDASTQTPTVIQHREYLDNVCGELFEKLSRLVRNAGQRQSSLYGNLTTEILHHSDFAKVRCEVFEGRKEILSKIKDYLRGNSQLPFTIHGNSGCGKTSVMAKILELIPGWFDEPPLTVIRFLGTSSLSSSLNQLLGAICKQLSSVTNDASWVEPDKFSELVAAFHAKLKAPDINKPLVLILDSVDQLMPTYNAFRMDWLPPVLPPGVKIVVSTITEGYTILERLTEKYESAFPGNFIEVLPLGEKTGSDIIAKWLGRINRCLTEPQRDVIANAFGKCSLPLYVRITFDQIRKWKSYSQPSADQLEATVRGAIEKLFQQLEAKFGVPIVKHALAYLSGSRFGLSEVELEHIMSLDDVLLNKIYTYWRPPVRRVPPLLWTRLRSDVNAYVVERSVDDALVLYWYHRQFITASKQRYLSDKDFANTMHCNMADYFLGKWNGREKPFTYTQAQQKRFGLAEANSTADRKVPSQPYIFQSSTGNDVRFNKRKLTELPFQLLKSKQYKDLRMETFFSFNWLYAKWKSSSASSVLEEFELFMQGDKSLRKDKDMKILYSTLQLVRPYVIRYPDSLGLELSGRLAKHVGKSAELTSLVKQCDEYGVKYCPLRPLLTCFEAADLGLKQNITFRSAETWVEGGTFAFTKDFKTMYVIDYDEQGQGLIQTWDVDAGDKVREVAITKERDPSVYDVHFQASLDLSQKHLIVLYKQVYYGLHKDRTKDMGFVDIISVEDGSVTKTVEGKLSRQPFFNPVNYITDHWIAVRFGWKVPLIHMSEPKRIDLSRAHRLTQDELKFALLHSKRSQVRYFVGEERTMAPVRSSQVCLRTFQTKEDIGELEGSDSADAIAVSKDNATMYISGRTFGSINIYDISKTREGACKPIKALRTLKLPRGEQVKVSAEVEATRQHITELDVDDIEEFEKKSKDKPICRVCLILSPDEEHLVACYSNKTAWEAFLWNASSGNFIARVVSDAPLTGRYPSFSGNSKHLVVIRDQCVNILTCKDGQSVQEYDMGQSIKDFWVSLTSNQVAVMRNKDVVFMDVEQEKDSRVQRRKGQQRTARGESRVLLRREGAATNKVLKEIHIYEEDGEASIREVDDAVNFVDTDAVTSARSRRKYALETWHTPDGLRTIQLHNRTQIVDITQQEIKYTPKKGEVVVRSGAPDSVGHITTKTFEIPGLESMGGSHTATLELTSGDRIVNEANKTKFRVGVGATSKLAVMSVPSTLTTFDVSEGKAQKLHCLTVYQESVVALSKEFFVTCKKKAASEFINVYSVADGKLLATHALMGQIAQAQFSTDNIQLFVVDKDLTFYVFSGESFMKGDQTIPLEETTTGLQYRVREILQFPQKPDRLCIRYNPEDTGSLSGNTYLFLDLTTKKKSVPISLTPAFEDISKDGTLGIDNRLNVYDLWKGCVTGKLPYSNASDDMQITARLTDDSSHVVIVDRHDDTLHIIKMLPDRSGREVATSCMHSPQLPGIGGFDVRQDGRVLHIRGSDQILLVIHDDKKREGKERVEYGSEMQRALSLVPV